MYTTDAGHVIVGLVAGLDYRNPLFDPHLEFQRFKTHPRIAALLEGFFRQLVHDVQLRYSVAFASLALWVAYLTLLGRAEEEPEGR